MHVQLVFYPTEDAGVYWDIKLMCSQPTKSKFKNIVCLVVVLCKFTTKRVISSVKFYAVIQCRV